MQCVGGNRSMLCVLALPDFVCCVLLWFLEAEKGVLCALKLLELAGGSERRSMCIRRWK